MTNNYSNDHDIIYNSKKTMCMCFTSKSCKSYECKLSLKGISIILVHFEHSFPTNPVFLIIFRFLTNCLAWLLILTSLQVGQLRRCNFLHITMSRLPVSSVIVHYVTFILM